MLVKTYVNPSSSESDLQENNQNMFTRMKLFEFDLY